MKTKSGFFLFSKSLYSFYFEIVPVLFQHAHLEVVSIIDETFQLTSKDNKSL